MVFRPPPRETIDLLNSILQKLDASETESSDLDYLRRSIRERITELESSQKVESARAESPETHHKAA